jgi:3-dehydroquinate synthase
LNLGHTFAHALETEAGYGAALLHGEAVAIGMALAFQLSARLALCSGQDATRVSRHLAAVGLPVHPSEIEGVTWRAERIVGHMMQDKKVKAGKPTFVLVRGIGQAFLTRDVDLADVENFLAGALACS